MAGDGTTFEIDIPVNGAGLGAAADSVARLSAMLDSASAASSSAAAAVRAGEAAYLQAEASADKAAKAVERIGLAADAQQGKLQAALDVGDASAAERAARKIAALAERQNEAAGKANEAAAAMMSEAAALDSLKGAAEKAAQAEAAVAEELDDAKKAAGNFKANELAEGFGKLGGPLGDLGRKAFGSADAMKKLSASLGSAGPYAAIAIAIVAIVAGVAALAVAAVGATVSVATWAVGLADAARTQGLLTQGIARSVKGGEQLADSIDSISNRVPLTADELAGLAGPLAQAGLKGQELSDALEDAAVKAATAKFGPNFVKQLNSLPMLSARAEASFSRIFSGLKIDELLNGLGSMVSLFDKGSASAGAISAIFESLFQPLIDGTTTVIPKVIAGFLQMMIGIMKGAIQVKKIWQEWGDVITTVAGIIGIVAAVIGVGLLVAIGAVVFSVGMLAVGVGLLVAAFLAVVAAVIWVGAQMYALGAAIVGGALTAFDSLRTSVQGVMDWLSGLSLAEIGMQMINGLVAGIMAAGPALLGSITGLAGGAIDAAKAALGIASPSKVFAELGAFTGEGMAIGVDSEAESVQGSMEAMVAPPEIAVAAVSGGGAAGAGASTSTTTNGGATYHITIQSSGGDKGLVSDLRNLMESLGAQAGLAVGNG